MTSSHQDTARSSDPTLEAQAPTSDTKNAELLLPPSIKNEAIYAITLSQAEMYDLGNIAFIDHFILIDRKTGIAIDTTAVIEQAQLLSAVPEGSVLPDEGRRQLESWLTGNEVPQYSISFPQGVNRLSAVEIEGDTTEQLRSAMSQVAVGRKAYDAAVKVLNQQVTGVKNCFDSGVANIED